LLSIAAVAGAPRSAQPAAGACPNGTCTVFLPLTTNEVAPILLGPVGNAQIISVAPSLSWRPSVPGLHKIQVTTDPNFAPTASLAVSTTKTIKLPIPAQVDTLLTSNLKAGTTYYWRVGVALPQGDFFSEIQSFTTPANVVLPGLVPILSPRNNAHISPGRMLLKWGAVPGAILYRIRMFDANGNQFNPGTTQVPGTDTTFWVENLTPGTYTWKIKVYTQVGWGPYGDDYTFRVS
jgi:hypothetical protein